jgi:hypothetical protein
MKKMMSRSSYNNRLSPQPENGYDLLRLQNVFRILAKPDHPLKPQAHGLQQEISVKWCDQAANGKWFPWPTTVARKGTGRLTVLGWRQQGMLSLLGYHVGETEPTPRNVRQCILEYAFECYLPPLQDIAYYAEWGPPVTPRRLEKLANTLAALVRNAKRRHQIAYRVAIDDWEHDLWFLHQRYYVDLFNFGWPATNLWH